MFLRIFICMAILSFSCTILKQSSNNMSKMITVVGTALDDKGYAILIVDTPNRKKYFLDGLEEWDKKYYGKKVKVTGRLVVEKHEKQSTDSVWIQEYVGTMQLIKKPKWSLVR